MAKLIMFILFFKNVKKKLKLIFVFLYTCFWIKKKHKSNHAKQVNFPTQENVTNILAVVEKLRPVTLKTEKSSKQKKFQNSIIINKNLTYLGKIIFW